MAVTYVVETTVNPGVSYEVSQAEYLRLLELGLLLNGPSEPVAPGVFDTEVSALLDDVNSQTYGKVAGFPPGPHQHPSTDISDSGSTGRQVLAATSALSARAAIGAVGDADARLSDARPATDTSVAALVNAPGSATATSLGAASAADRARANHTGTQPATTVSGLATVATSGSYNDLANKPTIPAAYAYPPGCAENPITNANASRPVGIPVVWWRTDTIPAAAAVNDVVELPGSAATAPSYLETFDATTGLWVASTNASAVTRDTTVGAGSPSSVTASLRWTATAAGDTLVRSPAITGLTPGTSYVATAQVRLSGTGTKTVIFQADYNDSGGTYLDGFYDYSTTVTAGASGFVYLTFAFTPVTNTGQVVLGVLVSAATLGQQAWIDNVRILA